MPFNLTEGMKKIEKYGSYIHPQTSQPNDDANNRNLYSNSVLNTEQNDHKEDEH